ncbi:hypothetical protein BZG36_02505 [Bifiguratus adelaidae]|uniref:Major facilitator superfamily (MFS) profile domain-containing protein n=1 Tax=Bifiguratus adelaidae TaxID=1938954 RepID=A0A261Y2S3_9FUNG|nr:hypothetical protein BZG36_02505 [Bifiguratus adelaidae]
MQEIEALLGEKPFPRRQLFILCICRFAEPVCFTVLFPFMYFMVRDFHVTDDPNKIPYYVGYIASSFAIAQFWLPWGYLSDRIGRRPVILMGLVGTITSIILFGLSQSYMWALLSRSLCGLLNGNVGVLKSMVAELTVDLSESQRARAFSLLPLMFGLGSILGPMLGGFLNHPVEQFPALFDGRGAFTNFFRHYPYFLPCFVGGLICFLGLMVGVFFLEETLGGKTEIETLDKMVTESARSPAETIHAPSLREARRMSQPNYGAMSNADSSPTSTKCVPSRASSPTPTMTNSTPTLRSVLTKPVLYIVGTYAMVCLQSIIYEELYVIWAAQPLSSGGLAFTSHQIGISLSIAGGMTLGVQLLCWPWIQRRLGTLRCFRTALWVYVIIYFLQGYIRELINFHDNVRDNTLVWIALVMALLFKTICSVTVFTSSMILISNSAPSLSTLGTINGFAQCMASGTRAIGPAVGGALYSWGLAQAWLPWHLRVQVVWLVLALVGFCTFSLSQKVRAGTFGKGIADDEDEDE